MKALFGGLLGDPAQVLLYMQAATTAALLAALVVRVLLDVAPPLQRYSRVLTLFVIEPLLLAFGAVLLLRLRG